VEDVVSWTRIAIIRHQNGTVTRRGFIAVDIEAAQDKALAWLRENYKPGDEIEIRNPICGDQECIVH
jgi:ferredoxin-NADP reductase